MTYPGWTGKDENSKDWDHILLGGIILPGIWKVDNLEVGIEVKIKKTKGVDKPTSTDCGLDPANLQIEGKLTEREWAEFQTYLPDWNPRRPGRSRGPVEVIHPLINVYGIKEVRITKVKAKQPSSKEGMEITIYLQEWFDAPVETKENKKPEKLGWQPASNLGYNPLERAGRLERGEQDLPPDTGGWGDLRSKPDRPPEKPAKLPTVFGTFINDMFK